MKEQRNLDKDQYARDSFSFRKMARWQLWGISIVVAALFIVFLLYLI